MGQANYTEIGYGVLVLHNDNDGKYSDHATDLLDGEMLGDGVLGEEEGMFYMSKDVMIDVSSGGYLTDWVEQYSKFNVAPEIDREVQRLADELIADGFSVKIGAFKVSYFG